MKRSIPSTYGRSVLPVLLLALCLPAWAAPPTPNAGTHAASLTASGQKQVQAAYGRLPLAFEPNRGQADPNVRFLAHGPGYNLSLTSREATLRLARRSPGDSAALRLQLLGSNAEAVACGQCLLPGKANYLLGNDPARWHTNVPLYQSVRFAGVYPGIDLLYYGNNSRLEYDFVLAAHANPSAIRLGFEGTRSVKIAKDGTLVLGLSGGQVRWHRPLVYQQQSGQRVEVAGRYVLVGQREVGFAVGRYDASKPLVIDPILVYSTYLGGNGNTFALAIAADSQGNAYAAGGTDVLSGNGTYDGFVLKLNPAGNTLIYAAFVGGSKDDVIRNIAVDSGGNAYVTGSTSSTNFPVTSGAFQSSSGSGGAKPTAFVTKLNADGSGFLYSTYLSG